MLVQDNAYEDLKSHTDWLKSHTEWLKSTIAKKKGKVSQVFLSGVISS